jgi:hypothetical protein
MEGLLEGLGGMPNMPQAYHAVTTEKFTSTTFDALDAEILSVFPRSALITPDDVRGDEASREAAVLRRG